MDSALLQQKIKTLKPSYYQRFNDEQRVFWGETKYEGPLSEDMPRFRQFVMMHESPSSLSIPFRYWKYVAFGKKSTNEDIPLNLNDIVTFLQACQRRTLKDWLTTYGQQINEITAANLYEDFCLHVEEMENYVNPIIDEHAMKLVDRLLKVQHIDLASG